MSDNITEETELQNKARQMSPIALAFMGDAVYETFVRDHVVSILHVSPSKLHRACVGFVKASSQAHAVRIITPLLTDEEKMILRRGRNANTTHVPKNAAPADYRYATAIEALFGYLYLCGRMERASELFKIITDNMSEEILQKLQIEKSNS